MPENQLKTIALVTGANKGIGFEIARGLGAKGFVVLLGSRDPGRAGSAAEQLCSEGLDARPVQLDVTDTASAVAAAAQIERDFGRLDILVNNAGVISEGDNKPSAVNPDAVRRTYETNVFGVVSVIQAMLPLLRLSAHGRIVNVSSSLGSLGLLSDPDSTWAAFNYLAYNTSKSALNGVTVAFANELRESGIKVNAVCPGYCATDINHHSGPRSAAQGAAIAIQLATIGDDGPTAGFFNDAGVIGW